MRTIGLFNNKGGVGKTSLTYHLAWMLAEMRVPALAVDLDPQANLTAMMLDEERVEAIWNADPRPTVHGAVAPLFRGIGDIRNPDVEEVAPRLHLLVGDMDLSRLEDDLASAWPLCANGQERAFRVMSAFSRTISAAGEALDAKVALIDMGPNLGALNRAVLLACDAIVVPLGADLFSIQGLRNMGPALREWRDAWQRHRAMNHDVTLRLPAGGLDVAGYVVMRHSVQQGRPARAFGQWMARIPTQYRDAVLGIAGGVAPAIEEDPNCLGILKDYRSLMPLAQEARKPMFALRPGDGAFGGHQAAVRACWDDFHRLALRLMQACTVAPPP